MASSAMPMDENARAALRAYELGRWRYALVGFAPVLVLPVMVLCLEGLTFRTGALGMALFLAGVFVLWRGQDAGAGALPGVAAGTVPLVAALCTPNLHVCTGETCMSLCLAACTGGGLIAGAAVGLAWRRSQRGRVALLVAAALCLITGALGCGCVGYAGVLGMAAGFGVGLLPGSLRRPKSSP